MVWRHIRFQSGSTELSESGFFFPQVSVRCVLGLCSCVSVQIFRLVQAGGLIWFSEDVKAQNQPGLPILFGHIASIQMCQYFSINIKSTQPGLRQSKLFKMECKFSLFWLEIMVSRIFCFKTAGSCPFLKGTAKPLTLTSFMLLAMCFS